MQISRQQFDPPFLFVFFSSPLLMSSETESFSQSCGLPHSPVDFLTVLWITSQSVDNLTVLWSKALLIALSQVQQFPTGKKISHFQLCACLNWAAVANVGFESFSSCEVMVIWVRYDFMLMYFGDWSQTYYRRNPPSSLHCFLALNW